VRDLAARLQVSPSTVSEAERGCDVLHSTLERYLAALTELTPQRLLGHGPVPRQEASPAVFAYLRSVFGLGVDRWQLRVDVDGQGTRSTHLRAVGARSLRGSLEEPAVRAAVAHLLFRGSAASRRLLTERARATVPGTSLEIADGCFRHEIRVPRSPDRWGLVYERRQVAGDAPPPGFPSPGSLALSAPFREGASALVEHPVEEMELIAGFPPDALPRSARAAAWADVQSLSPDEPDFTPFLHPDGLRVARRARAGLLVLSVREPVVGLHYGMAWDAAATAAVEARRASATDGAAAAPSLAAVLRAAREQAGWSQRELASRLQVSPVTVSRVESGHDVRCSTLSCYLRELPALSADRVFPQWRRAGAMARLDAWEHYRSLMGIEADEERKTLVITAEGDAHAVCETLRLRRVRPSEADLRIRYSSVQALGRRLPTVLKAIEEAIAAEAEDSGLKARVITRREGRLIHEITVPCHLAQVGASYARRLFDAKFFDPRADEAAGEGRRFDGAAIVPNHAVRRLRLTVKLPAGAWPERVWFGVHPRMLLEAPLEEADLAPWLHPEGLETTVSRKNRTLALSVEHPLVGFIYDIFWERPA
jgi:transcriptional regulator with XRE-family HTH domain